MHQKMDRKHKIEEVVHILEIAALILAIITLGKYLEGKSKHSIISMTQQIFASNKLVANLSVKYVELKNKRFDIDKEQHYDISYLDKDDFIYVEAPFKLLTDTTVAHISSTGPLKAIDQVCYGWDDAFSVQKGQTLKSGSEITEGTVIL